MNRDSFHGLCALAGVIFGFAFTAVLVLTRGGPIGLSLLFMGIFGGLGVAVGPQLHRDIWRDQYDGFGNYRGRR